MNTTVSLNLGFDSTVVCVITKQFNTTHGMPLLRGKYRFQLTDDFEAAFDCKISEVDLENDHVNLISTYGFGYDVSDSIELLSLELFIEKIESYGWTVHKRQTAIDRILNNNGLPEDLPEENNRILTPGAVLIALLVNGFWLDSTFLNDMDLPVFVILSIAIGVLYLASMHKLNKGKAKVLRPESNSFKVKKS